MTHSAGPEFFDTKRAWSVRKDRILGSYLAAYIPKVSTQGYPILIVDGFAGAGKFKDGSPGSPLIIAQTISGSGKDAKLWAVESNRLSAERLKHLLTDFGFAKCINANFLDTLPSILREVQSHSVFFYLDPFAIKGLSLESLASIFDWVNRGRSVEVLINFNASAFSRCARAAMRTETGGEPKDEEVIRSITPEELSSFAGGDWWKKVILKRLGFSEEVSLLIEGYCSRLRKHFSEVCFHEIREHINHSSPKYVLVFASRHPAALLLMNDEMVKSRDTLVEQSRNREGFLFEMAPLQYVPDPMELNTAVLSVLTRRMSRGELVTAIVHSQFGRFSTGSIKKLVSEHIKSGILASSTGTARINDKVHVWRI